MKLIYEPTVKLIQASRPYDPELQEIANNSAPEGETHSWEPDASLLEVVPIFAGRVCYQSFGSRAGRKTADEYLGHILDVKHLSVLEHSSVTFYLEGVSRSFSHELVRHRIASPSQLSQRYVAPEELAFVVPPAYRDRPDVVQDILLPLWDNIANIYDTLLSPSRIESTPTSEKKKIREAARCVLPNATETKMVWTANLRSFVEMLVKRNSQAADAEIHQVAEKIEKQLSALAPNIFRNYRG